MKKTSVHFLKFCIAIFVLIFILINGAEAAPKFVPFSKLYGRELCKKPEYTCSSIEKNISWEKFWPNKEERLLIMKLNRLNVPLKARMVVAIPKDLQKPLLDFSPFPKKIDKPEEKFVVFDPALLAWGAYDNEGNLIRWAPALGGNDWCFDTRRPCRTVVGDKFRVIERGTKDSRSSSYPLGCPAKKPCAPMPYVMYFYKLGRPLYGIHGSDRMVGFNDSHGCVRTFTDDAEWLNKEFMKKRVGTKVIVKPYSYPNPYLKKRHK